MSDKLYLLISNLGNELLSEQKSEELVEYLTQTDWLEIDVKNQHLFLNGIDKKFNSAQRKIRLFLPLRRRKLVA